jgi:hypothetical protein
MSRTRQFKVTYSQNDHMVFHAILVSNGIVDRTISTVEGDNYFIVMNDPWIKQVYDLLCDCNEANITIIVSRPADPERVIN